MKPAHRLALTKRLLKEQVIASGVKEALLHAVKAFTDCSWQCYLLRKIEPRDSLPASWGTYLGRSTERHTQEKAAAPLPPDKIADRNRAKTEAQFDRDVGWAYNKLADAFDTVTEQRFKTR